MSSSPVKRAPLHSLRQAVDQLMEDAGALAADVAAEARASAVRADLARHVLPLSAKDTPYTRDEWDRHRAGLERRRVRLQREGRVLARRVAQLSARGAQLRRSHDALLARLGLLDGSAGTSGPAIALGDLPAYLPFVPEHRR